MGLKKRKKIIKQNNPDMKILASPSMDCPVIDCDSDVVDLSFNEETETYVKWDGICRVCDNHFVVTMEKG